ncbi:MAG: hypothetical protein C0490_00480 [Marivirga sp.]|nr:hypothetical protein [Marivirga sp.]
MYSNSENEIRAIFEHTFLGIGRVRFADAKWLQVNDAFCRMLGRSREEMLSTPWMEITHPQDLDLDMIPFRKLSDGEIDSYTVEKRFIHANGDHIWARLNLTLVRDSKGSPDYELAIIENINDRKMAEEKVNISRIELDDERQKLEAIIDTIPIGLVMIGNNESLILENTEWTKIWVGKPSNPSTKYFDSFKAFSGDAGKRILSSEWPSVVSLNERKELRDVILDIERFDGSKGTIVVTSAPIFNSKKEVIGAVAANLDITEFRNAQLKLIESDRRKDEFLAMLSHELRNPIAPISAAAELIGMSKMTASRLTNISTIIRRQVKHLTGLLDDLLDVTRVTRGLITLNKQSHDFRNIVSIAIEQIKPSIVKLEQHLFLDMPAIPIGIYGDQERLIQVVANLLNNASKYTPVRGSISLKLSLNLEDVTLQIRDSGVGISNELIPHVFELFSQAERSSDRSQGGLGLGLAIVKNLLELHNGSVICESEGIGKGSTFTVTLPNISETSNQSVTSQFIDPARANQNLKIIVVDDNIDAADMLQILLEEIGYEVIVAYEPYAALKIIENKSPDVVILDIGLPGINGYELARRIRMMPSDHYPFLIALTGYGQNDDRKEALEAGFDEHFTKPLTMEKLITLLNSTTVKIQDRSYWG